MCLQTKWCFENIYIYIIYNKISLFDLHFFKNKENISLNNQ